jgi:hypothetical protein
LTFSKSYTAVITVTDNHAQSTSATVNFDTFDPSNFAFETEDFDFDPGLSPVSNGSGLRYIDNPTPTSAAATDSYFGQISDLGIDVATIFGDAHPGGHTYRASDYVSTENTTDVTRQRYITAQQLNIDPTIVDHDVAFWTNNGWIDWTRTFPSGQFYVYGRLSAGNGAFNLQCSRVTNGAGTSSQTTSYLGTFKGTGASFTTWQYVPLINTNNSQLVAVTFNGLDTLQMLADGNENANFFMLVPVAQQVNLTATLSGGNVSLSFPTQTGFTYTVQYKNHLTDSTWLTLGSVSGDGTVKSLSDGTGQPSRFYRLSIQ